MLLYNVLHRKLRIEALWSLWIKWDWCADVTVRCSTTKIIKLQTHTSLMFHLMTSAAEEINVQLYFLCPRPADCSLLCSWCSRCCLHWIKRRFYSDLKWTLAAKSLPSDYWSSIWWVAIKDHCEQRHRCVCNCTEGSWAAWPADFKINIRNVIEHVRNISLSGSYCFSY